MDIQEFESKVVQEYKNESEKITYLLTYVGEQTGYSIRLYDDRFINSSDYDGEFLGTTPDNGDNIKMMAWEYNAVPVREVF